MYKLLSILLIFSFTFTQEPCIGTCYTEEEEINIENHISTLEQNNELNNVKIKELENMIKLYEEKDKNSQVYLNLQIQKNEVQEYEPKYNRLICFDSNLHHQVLPVTLGVRVALSVNFWTEKPIGYHNGNFRVKKRGVAPSNRF